MKTKNYTNEFKVGLFVLLCLAGLAYLTFSTGRMNFKKGGYSIYVLFDDTAGLESKAPVRLNGFEVGKVDEIKINEENDSTRIMLKLWLEDGARVRENAKISIKTLGLMGEKYIQISSSAGAGFIKPDTLLKGEPYLDLDKLLASVSGTVEDNKDSITAIVKNLETTSRNFEEFSGDIKRNPWKLLFRSKEKKAEEK
ncbi:MAG: MCE family protein [Candidatus Omnitrophica bacterium]|nr:MCE family protein [Candidatus Omnitrophota bacterium]